MYIVPNKALIPEAICKDDNIKKVLIICSTMDVPKKTYTKDSVIPQEENSEAQKDNEEDRLISFCIAVSSALDELNKQNKLKWKWERKVLNPDSEKTKEISNVYSEIYNADAIIIECTNEKPDIFYLLGLAHTCGCPVCPCYYGHSSIPFNVHGRQSMVYTLKDSDDEHNLKTNIKNWINHFSE